MPTLLAARQAVDTAAPQSVNIAETSFGKDISIAKGRDGRLFVINVAGGGTKPPMLEGHFTRFNEAEDAIKRYIDGGNGRITSKPDVEHKHPESRLPSTTNRPALQMKPGPEQPSFKAEPAAVTE